MRALRVILPALRFRYIGQLFGSEPSGTMQEHMRYVFPQGHDIKKFRDKDCQVCRSRHCNLQIPPHNDRITMVSGMAPAPWDRFAQHHKGSDFVKCVVHPVCLEGCPMSGFMPARVGCRGIQDPIDRKRNNSPPTAPEKIATYAKDSQQCKPEQGIAERWAIVALEQGAHLLFGNRGGIPARTSQAFLDRQNCVFSKETVITHGIED